MSPFLRLFRPQNLLAACFLKDLEWLPELLTNGFR
jgi:hypothetical protein